MPKNRITKRLLLGLATGALLLAAAGLLLFRSPAEPSYQGKTLTQWLTDLDYSGRAADLAARNAVNEMGKEVLAYLKPALRAQDTPIKGTLMKLLMKQSLIKVRFTPAFWRRHQAAAACRALGPRAVQYVPELTAMLNRTNNTEAWAGLAALLDVKGRSNCVPELTMGLTNSSGQVRWFSASVIGEVWGHAGSALPALLRCLEDADPRVRESAIGTLAKFKFDAPVVVPAFIKCLDSPHARTRNEAATYLISFGDEAAPARAKLSTLLNDPDPEVQRSARLTLSRLTKP